MSRPREPLPTRIQGLPRLPPRADAALDAGLADLGIEIPAAARDRLLGHLRLLLAWNTAINLTAIRDPVAAVTSHVLDSLVAVPLVRGWGVGRLLDLGSGAGYPGLPLAVAVPAGALLVDSIGKKARFLETAADALGLAPDVSAAHVRAEALAHDRTQREAWPLVTARAVGGLADLVELAFPLLEPGGRLVAWRSRPSDGELVSGQRAVAALGRGSLAVEDVGLAALPDHVLVVAQKGGRTPDAYPREPAARERRPW